jgi:hypothetical protein
LEIASKDADSVTTADPDLKGDRAKALRLARELLTPRVAPDSDAGS